MQNNFEKQVQQKMDELRFEPTPPVWQKVALQIQTEKKRRRFFIWLPILTLLTAGGIWWVVQLENSPIARATSAHQANGVQPKKTAETVLPSETVDQFSSQENVIPKKINQLPLKNAIAQKTNEPVAEPKTSIEKSEPGKENAQIQDGQSVSTSPGLMPGAGGTVQRKTVEKRNATQRLADNVAVKNSVTDGGGAIEKQLETVTDKRLETLAAKNLETDADKRIETAPDKQMIVAAIPETAIKKVNPVTLGDNPSTKIKLVPRSSSEGAQQKPVEPIIKKPALKDTTVVLKIASAIQPDTTAAVQPTVMIQLPGKNKWQLQVNAAAGISGLSHGINLFGGLFSGEKSMADATAFATPGSAPPTARRAPSTIRNGFAFSIGASAEKKISRRLSFSAGLQYNYYSTSLVVGQLTRQDSVVRNSLQLNQFYANSGAGFSNKTNSYHFISLPMSLNWQVNKKLPLYLKTGFSLQQMVAANAVLYDAGSNIYYTDNNALNKTQTFLHTAITWRVVNKKKFSMHIGPQLQYGISQLEKNKSGNHLFAASIGTQISFSGK